MVLLVLIVNDSEYNNSTGQKPIQCHCDIYQAADRGKCDCSNTPAQSFERMRFHEPSNLSRAAARTLRKRDKSRKQLNRVYLRIIGNPVGTSNILLSRATYISPW